MGQTPQAFMIYKEELRKAEVEKKRLKEEYEAKLAELRKELFVLKERISSQEDMMRRVTEYASELEDQINHVTSKIDLDISKNQNGYH
jgi:cob(I)alamin adenosyltransferase